MKRGMIWFARVSAALGFTAGAVVMNAGPAQAWNLCDEISRDSRNLTIQACGEDSWLESEPFAPRFQLFSSVKFDAGATSATGCKVTMYAMLDKPNSNPWNSAKVTRDCSNALRSSGWFDYVHGASNTSATAINTRVCVDLYYNHSTSSGWQRCHDSGWHPIQLP
jgi:hypothetical protein